MLRRHPMLQRGCTFRGLPAARYFQEIRNANGSSFQLMCALQECLNSNDPEYVTQECIWLRKARASICVRAQLQAAVLCSCYHVVRSWAGLCTMQTRSHEPAAGSVQKMSTATDCSAHSQELWASGRARIDYCCHGCSLHCTHQVLLVRSNSAVLAGSASGSVATGLRKDVAESEKKAFRERA